MNSNAYLDRLNADYPHSGSVIDIPRARSWYAQIAVGAPRPCARPDARTGGLRQLADQLLQREESMNAVLLAYGSHHIEPDRRAEVVQEAYAALAPGGIFLLHDFLSGSPMDEWFTEVVDRHAPGGHQFTHFSHEEMSGYLAKAGFETYEVVDTDDSSVFAGDSAEAAELSAGRYLLDMYDLERIRTTWGAEADRWVIERAKETFEECAVYQQDGSWWCRIPRDAIVGVGRKLG